MYWWEYCNYIPAGCALYWFCPFQYVGSDRVSTIIEERSSEDQQTSVILKSDQRWSGHKWETGEDWRILFIRFSWIFLKVVKSSQKGPLRNCSLADLERPWLESGWGWADLRQVEHRSNITLEDDFVARSRNVGGLVFISIYFCIIRTCNITNDGKYETMRLSDLKCMAGAQQPAAQIVYTIKRLEECS